MTISAVILTKNEEKNIEACLESLRWCSERIVIDDESVDKTVALAKKQGALVFSHPLHGDFAQSRNFGLEKTKGDWILFVDADERVSTALKNEIVKRTEEDNVKSFFLKREDVLWGRALKHGEQGNVQLLRLAKKGTGKWSGKVHEVWKTTGTTFLLENPLQHFPHPTIAEFLKEINFYSTLRAKELHDSGATATWFSILLYAKGKFFQDYVVKLGFLDGIEGFIVALLMSMHSFLVRGKLWQYTNK